jgi:hypothetical protein
MSKSISEAFVLLPEKAIPICDTCRRFRPARIFRHAMILPNRTTHDSVARLCKGCAAISLQSVMKHNETVKALFIDRNEKTPTSQWVMFSSSMTNHRSQKAQLQLPADFPGLAATRTAALVGLLAALARLNDHFACIDLIVTTVNAHQFHRARKAASSAELWAMLTPCVDGLAALEIDAHAISNLAGTVAQSTAPSYLHPPTEREIIEMSMDDGVSDIGAKVSAMRLDLIGLTKPTDWTDSTTFLIERQFRSFKELLVAMHELALVVANRDLSRAQT